MDNSQTTKQYARVLLELKLGRILTDSETVDHIDMDFTNDSVENLQVLTRELNASKSAIKRKEQTVECVWCGTEFNLTKDQVNKRAKGLAGPFCSKTCTGHYGQQVQTSGVVLTERQQENTEYYV